jgi:hypothetical protein
VRRRKGWRAADGGGREGRAIEGERKRQTDNRLIQKWTQSQFFLK